MAQFVGQLAAKRFLGKEMDKQKHKKVAGGQDPYFELITLKNGKTKKVKKQIPDFIPEHDAKVLAAAKKRAYSLDCCLFDFLGIRFGWSSVIGIIPELGDLVDLAFALDLMSKCSKIDGGLSFGMKSEMFGNITIDFVIGLVPFLGDLADAFYRCNTRNVAILEKHLIKKYGGNLSKQEQRRSQLEPFDKNDDIAQILANESPPQYTEQPPQHLRQPPAMRGQNEKPGSNWWFGRSKRQPDVERGEVSVNTSTANTS